MSVELLTEHPLGFLSLRGGCTGWSESTLVKLPHCWKSRVTANLFKYGQLILESAGKVPLDFYCTIV